MSSATLLETDTDDTGAPMAAAQASGLPSAGSTATCSVAPEGTRRVAPSRVAPGATTSEVSPSTVTAHESSVTCSGVPDSATARSARALTAAIGDPPEVDVQAAGERRRDRRRRGIDGGPLDREAVRGREERQRARIDRDGGVGERQGRIPLVGGRRDAVGEVRHRGARNLLDGQRADRVVDQSGARVGCLAGRGLRRVGRGGARGEGERRSQQRHGDLRRGDFRPSDPRPSGFRRSGLGRVAGGGHRPSLRTKSRSASAAPESTPSSCRRSVARTGVPA